MDVGRAGDGLRDGHEEVLGEGVVGAEGCGHAPPPGSDGRVSRGHSPRETITVQRELALGTLTVFRWDPDRFSSIIVSRGGGVVAYRFYANGRWEHPNTACSSEPKHPSRAGAWWGAFVARNFVAHREQTTDIRLWFSLGDNSKRATATLKSAPPHLH